MQKSLSIVLFILFSTVFVSAQSSDDDYKKKEFFVGYSSNSVVDDESYVVGRGFNAAGVYNFKRYIGIKGDVSADYGRTLSASYTPFFDNPTRAGISYKTRDSIYNYVGGVQFKNNSSEARFKPFAHTMAGVGQYRVRVREANCTTSANCSLIPVNETDTGLAIIVGGGLDIKVGDKIDLRVVQVDVNSISFKRSVSGRESANTFRFSAGIVFK